MDDEVRVGPTSADLVIGGAIVAAVGVGLGLVLAVVVEWLLGLSWAPLQGPARLVDQVLARVPGWVPPVVLGVVGAVVGALGTASDPVITLRRDEVIITAGDNRQRFARGQVSLARLDGAHLVLRDAADVELAHQKVHGDKRRLAAALTDLGWRSPAP